MCRESFIIGSSVPWNKKRLKNADLELEMWRRIALKFQYSEYIKCFSRRKALNDRFTWHSSLNCNFCRVNGFCKPHKSILNILYSPVLFIYVSFEIKMGFIGKIFAADISLSCMNHTGHLIYEDSLCRKSCICNRSPAPYFLGKKLQLLSYYSIHNGVWQFRFSTCSSEGLPKINFIIPSTVCIFWGVMTDRLQPTSSVKSLATLSVRTFQINY